MKLGICYMVFDGEELLEFAVKSVRTQIDHISVTYQTTSYFGNPSSPDLPAIVDKLKSDGLIDEAIHYEPDLTLTPKDNELRLRNIGLNASRKAGCTHHISADVDEFYRVDQLEYAKRTMDADYSVAYLATYYKDPTYLVVPVQNLMVSFIHSVEFEYNRQIKYPEFPFRMEETRRFADCKSYKVFSKEEITIHHMSYVRRDIRKKLNNSDNGRCYKKEKFVAVFDSYKLGDRVCLLPDFLNRKTTQVENVFGILI